MILGCVAVLGVAGCSNTVELDTPVPGGASGTLCQSLLKDAPSTVAGQDSRDVDPPAAGRAWGDPAILLQCGVSKPRGLTPTSRCAEINNVGWFAERGKDAYVFTTIGRATYVQVTVPREYEPASDALVDLAKTIKQHDPVERRCV